MSLPRLIGGHHETIRCPQCRRVQLAAVEHTEPWWSYVHECACGYIITESEWELDKLGNSELDKAIRDGVRNISEKM